MVGAEAFDGKVENMKTLEFCTVGMDPSQRSQDMGDATAKVLLWKMTIFKQPGSSGIIQGGSIHV